MSDPNLIPGGLGRALAAIERSLRGLVSAGILMGGIFGLLGAFFYLRAGAAVVIGAVMLVLLAAITLVVFLRQPRRGLFCERGILLTPFVGGARVIPWEKVRDVKLRRAPLGRQPLILRFALEEGEPVSFSEAEYHGVHELIEVVREKLGERFVDETM